MTRYNALLLFTVEILQIIKNVRICQPFFEFVDSFGILTKLSTSVQNIENRVESLQNLEKITLQKFFKFVEILHVCRKSTHVQRCYTLFKHLHIYRTSKTSETLQNLQIGRFVGIWKMYTCLCTLHLYICTRVHAQLHLHVCCV